MLVQYAGDWRQAYQSLQKEGSETYYGHRYVLETLERFRATYGDVAVLCCLSGELYDEVLPNGVTVMGAQAHPRWKFSRVAAIIEAWRPTHLVVLGALTPLIGWGARRDLRLMCQMADSFEFSPVLRFAKFGRLAAVLNRPQVEWIGNHGENACRSLVRIGTNPDKVLPWDWPYTRNPEQVPIRGLPQRRPHQLLYVGTVQTRKGVGDAIEAVARLVKEGGNYSLDIVGGEDVLKFRALADQRGVGDRVQFSGRIGNDAVFDRMTEATAVLVPSRHDYPEGLPLTIYEALCARTPVVASDHPMFAGHLRDRETAMVFRAGDAADLAAKIRALTDDADLYERISANSQTAWTRMQNPTKWGDTIEHWLRDTPESQRWLHERTLGSRF